eukprot:15481854-Alexandrium_andersonii.AAC.1
MSDFRLAWLLVFGVLSRRAAVRVLRGFLAVVGGGVLLRGPLVMLRALRVLVVVGVVARALRGLL